MTPATKQQYLTPVERRRQNAREQLKETSELAAILCSDAAEPTPSNTSTDDTSISFPSSLNQVKSLKKLVQLIQALPDPKCNNNDNSKSSGEDKMRKQIKDLLKRDPQTPRYWITLELMLGKQDKDLLLPSKTTVHPVTPLCLHLAARVGNTLAWQLLSDHDTRFLEQGTVTKGHTPLHTACIYGHAELVTAMCLRNPLSCRVMDHAGNLPVHLAMAGCVVILSPVTPWIVSTLLANYPKAIMIPNKEGYLPIHLASMNALLGGIKIILAVSAKVVEERSKSRERLLPVDLALQGHKQVINRLTKLKDPTSIEGFQYLSVSTNDLLDTMTDKELTAHKIEYEEAIEVLLMSALYGRAVMLPREEKHSEQPGAPFFLPLHAGLWQTLQPASWNHLLSIYGNRHVLDVDRNGRNLLHALAESSVPSDEETEDKEAHHGYEDDQLIDMIGQVHSSHPKAHLELDHQGMLPLQLAIVSLASARVIQALVDCDPDTVKAQWNGPLERTY